MLLNKPEFGIISRQIADIAVFTFPQTGVVVLFDPAIPETPVYFVTFLSDSAAIPPKIRLCIQVVFRNSDCHLIPNSG
jgi:hypothetical protein